MTNINSDPPSCLSQGTSSDRIDLCRDIEYDSHSGMPDESAGRLGPGKRKRPSSPGNNLTKKHKHQLQTSTHRARLESGRCSERSNTSHSGCSTSSTHYNTKGRLPSPVPCMAHTTDTEMRSNSSVLGRGPSDSLPTLTEITFRPQSPRSCSFTTVVQDGCEGQGVSFG